MTDTFTPWATVDDVQNATGITVDATTLGIAKMTIEGKTGLIEAVPRLYLYDRDRYWLKLAVCFQAAWLSAQPDFLERNSVAAASQDGQSATAGNADWLTLAPMARTYLKRLSWRGPRKLLVGTDGRVRDTYNAVTDDESNDYSDIQRMPGTIAGGPIGPDPLLDSTDDSLSWSSL